jgi:5-methylcytosine-specific restriction endonuclease McrA
METKHCNTCTTELPLSDFHKLARAKDGLQPRCKSCNKAAGAAWYKENKERRKAKSKEWYESNRDEHNANCRKYQRENKEVLYPKQRQWKSDNSDRKREVDTAWLEKNPAYSAQNTAKYRASKLQRTPPWADMSAVAAFYTEAKRLEELTGIKFHVDHIVPLQGELVSGLHVESNLQLLTAHENQSKSNSFAVAA